MVRYVLSMNLGEVLTTVLNASGSKGVEIRGIIGLSDLLGVGRFLIWCMYMVNANGPSICLSSGATAVRCAGDAQMPKNTDSEQLVARAQAAPAPCNLCTNGAVTTECCEVSADGVPGHAHHASVHFTRSRMVHSLRCHNSQCRSR